jgi:hypothetical protein
MAGVRLVHWKPEEAGARAKAGRLRAAGHRVRLERPEGTAFLKSLRESRPDVLVIDLDRVPSHGRDIALAVRHQKATRGIPLVLAGGETEKVQRIRRHLPDAVFTSWRGIRAAVRRAIAQPPSDPVAPSSVLAGYSGTPLPRKLGIKPGFVVALVGAPPRFERKLGKLPEGVTLRRSARGQADLTLWFVTRRSELERRVRAMAARTARGHLWIVWPKKASGRATDFGQKEVRAAGLGAGIVDFKIAALDETWSGLCFAARRKPR